LKRNTITEELVYAASMLTMVEMVQGGVTCFADMYYFEQRVAEAAEEIGLRCILGETILSHSSPDAPTPYGGIEIAAHFIDAYNGHSLITPAAAPHAPYSLDEEHMKICGEISERSGTPLLIHLSEMPFEMEQFRETPDGTPVAWMNRLGLVNSRLIAAHCIHVDESDIGILASGDVGVIHNAAANMKSGKAVAPVTDMLNLGLRVGLGTDGPMSGNTMDIVNQLGYVAKIHKTVRRNPTVMPARTVVEMATMGGAQALHLDHLIGSLEVGKRADVVVVATDSMSMFPMHNPWSALVYGASPRDIDTVLVDGRILMENRVLGHMNLNIVKAEAKHQCDRIAGVVRNL
jgi:5-methylthioadenosine/S-adenosylhomocysteine deaminase